MNPEELKHIAVLQAMDREHLPVSLRLWRKRTTPMARPCSPKAIPATACISS